MEFERERGIGKLYWIKDGEYREIGQISDMSLETIAEPIGEDAKEFPIFFPKDAECSITVDVTSAWPEVITAKLNLKCKTRKKFKKLLMSIGYSRNEAELYPYFAVPAYGSYRKAWKAAVMSMVNWVF